MYSLTEFEVDFASSYMLKLSLCYLAIYYNGQILGTFKNRAASLSIVMTKCLTVDMNHPHKLVELLLYTYTVSILKE